MSYTLRGRLESRLGVLLAPVLAACALAAAAHAWWPLQLAGLMAAVGLALDLAVYDRLLPYQPGWAALPLGALELALVMGLARALGVAAPLGSAIAFFAAAWLWAQLLGHAAFPLLQLSYAEDGGELGRTGALSGAAVAVVLAAAGGLAWGMQPPTVHLSAGVHRGPLVIARSERLVGEPGAIVRGGIVVRANDVTIRNVGVVGGDNGIDVESATGVVLDGVTVSGAALDGIHARRSAVTIENCTVDSGSNPYAQGIDVSYSFDKHHSSVTGCTVTGGQEGIVAHFTNATLMGNRVSGTRLRGISMTEMSMGMIEGNEVRDSRGVGIYCNDHSTCMVERNVVVDTRADRSDDGSRAGFGVLASYGSTAELRHNRLGANPRPFGAVFDSHVHER